MYIIRVGRVGNSSERMSFNERMLRGAKANNKRPRLSGHLEDYFLREYGGKPKANRMERLHQMYYWLSSGHRVLPDKV